VLSNTVSGSAGPISPAGQAPGITPPELELSELPSLLDDPEGSVLDSLPDVVSPEPDDPVDPEVSGSAVVLVVVGSSPVPEVSAVVVGDVVVPEELLDSATVVAEESSPHAVRRSPTPINEVRVQRSIPTCAPV
jgi:hypothetical protein